MKVRDIIGAIEEFAPLRVQEDWDNSGLQIGSPDAEVSGVLLGFDCTPDLVREAVEKDSNLIITHHPLLFNGIKNIYPDDFTGRAVIEAIKGGIAIYAAHTSADKVIDGVSGALAQILGLQNIRVLDPEGEGIGLGAIGDLPTEMPAAEALELVKSRLHLPVVRASRYDGITVKTIAICGGAGASLIDKARAEGAQLYLCGDVSYHHFFTSGDFIVADIGHFESEVQIVDIFHTILQKKFPNFAPLIQESVHNPINYL